MTDKINRTHGSTGNQPADGKEFKSGERPENEHFDWFWYTVTERINSILDDISNIVSGSTKVGAASTADDATNVTGSYKGNDIDSDGDGKVDSAEYADSADDADTVDGVEASNIAKLGVGVQVPVYSSTNDVPSSIGNGEFVVIDGDGLYMEDGN